MLTQDLKDKAEAISKEVRKRVGDVGSCILGYNMDVYGERIVSQPAQGSCTCYEVYKAITEMLIEEGVSEEDINIDTGVMD